MSRTEVLSSRPLETRRGEPGVVGSDYVLDEDRICS
jgi:hypothetical protein